MISPPVRLVWRSLQVVLAVAIVVVPFAYAVTGVQNDVLLAAGCGLAMAAGLCLRLRERIARSVCILVGSAAGLAVALLAGLIPGDGAMWILPAPVALAVGLIQGFAAEPPRGYRSALVETVKMSSLIGVGLMPALGPGGFLACQTLVPPTALIAGALSPRPPGPPRMRWPVALALGSTATTVLTMFIVFREQTNNNGLAPDDALESTVVAVPLSVIVIPLAVFLAARAAAAWLRPRLDIYRQLMEYLRVMWLPIGAFAVGHAAIIVVFAGFGGMLARFRPGAFAGAADAGIGDWIAYAFFRAVAQDYSGITPVSGWAWLLVGIHTAVAVGWALVVFAAVMSSIQPRLERIASRAIKSPE